MMLHYYFKLELVLGDTETLFRIRTVDLKINMPPKDSTVLIKWKSEGRWYDVEQPVPRKTIDPKEGPLNVGQRVLVRFNKKWCAAEICESQDGKSTGIFRCLSLPFLFKY